MRIHNAIRTVFPGQFAVLVLASAMAVPAIAQDSQPASQPTSTPPAASTSQPQSTPPAAKPASSTSNLDKEGFWGHVNPFARKSWVKKRTDPINDRLSELDEVNAKNASDIKDVDARAQAGIRQAQSTADSANQTATAASTQAQNANGIAQGASTHVDQLNGTVQGLDQYKQISDLNVPSMSSSCFFASAERTMPDLKGTFRSLICLY